MRVFVTGIFLALIVQLVPVSASEQYEEADNPALVMGVFPRRSAQTTQRLFKPLSQVLSRELGVNVNLETTHDFATFWENVANKRYDIVHYNQYHYVKSHKQFGYRVIAQNVEFGHKSIAGAIIVRKDSGIESPADLKGKTVVFGGGRGAMQAYITATYLLRQAGLKKGDYFEQFALNPPKACIATYYRKASAAGAGNYVLDLPQVKKQIDTDEMKYLIVSQRMAHLPWAVKSTISAKTEKRIQNVLVNLVNLESGKKVLDNALITRFLPVTDMDYDAHREIIKTVMNEEY